MGLRRRLRKIIPREIRDNPVLAIAAVALIGPAALGALGASTAAIAGATVAANTAAAIAIGTGVVTAGITYVQGGTVSDSLKAGVLSGAGSYAGSVVSNSVSNAVSNATGAPLGGGVGATVTPSGQFASTAGGTGFGAAGATGFQTAANAGQILGVANPTFAGFLAGNVAGRSTEAAITGKPIEQAALFGAAQSIGFGLDRMPDFKTLPRPVQDVLVSSAQAAVMGQDVGDAVIESIVRSTNVVGKALKEVPGGIEFTERNPIATRYIINTVSSALAAQLQGKEISDTVLESLVRTTASVLRDEFANSQVTEEVTGAQAAYNEAQQLEQQTLAAQNKLNEYVQQNRTDVNNYNYYKNRYNYVYTDLYKRYDERATNALNSAQRMREDPFWVFYEGQFGRTIETYEQEAAKNIAQRDVFIPDVNEAVAGLNSSYEKLQKVNFFDTYNQLQSEFNNSNRQLSAKLQELQDFSTNLAQNSADLFTDFETELATTLAPLTAFEETDVTDQDLLAEISPVAPPSPEIGVEVAGPVSPEILRQLQSMPLTGERVFSEKFVDDPDLGGGVNTRFIVGSRNDGTPYYYIIATKENGEVFYAAVDENDELQLFDNRPDLKSGSLNLGNVPVSDLTGDGTGTPGAPAIDLGAQAPTEIVDPAFTIGFDLRTYGPGSPTSPNLAVFEIGGGRGTPGGSSTDTTFNLISRDTVTGQETYDVGGKQYSLIVLPDKQVLVPTEPSEVIVYLERDPVTDRPKMKEVPVTQVPQQDAVQIAAKVEETAGGAPTGAEGVAGGLTAETPTTTTPAEQLQPGVRPEEVAPGVSAEAPAPSFPDLISGITEPVMPAPVPGADAGFEDALQAPGAGGVGDEITDEDIIRIIQGEMGEAGGGEGEGLPGEEGAGPGEGEEGAGPGAGEEGEGEGAGGEGEGTGEGVGPGTGEGGTPETQLPQPSPDIVPTITTVGRRTFARPAEGAPYRVTGMDESGILGRKQPLFGGDEDLQRAEWNRRSLRLRRLLGL